MKDIAFREKELNGWLDAYPDANVVRLDNVGHYVQEEGKADLSQAMKQFL